ncbi:alpha/beta fold hydrolase [Streptomyces goshikiensis]|uniref:alpha/beta fold hydrolase n=1 Tax=Streptomyces goshikiensis TaxID=1942 RepID=UPI00371EEA7C
MSALGSPWAGRSGSRRPLHAGCASSRAAAAGPSTGSRPGSSDRRGGGVSEGAREDARGTPVRGTRALPASVQDLDRALTAGYVPGPYLLVGHSFGGMLVLRHGQEHPERTRGLVLVDALGPG